MSKRSDIIDPAEAPRAGYGLVYSEVLGWIDLGHATGGDIRSLLAQMQTGENGQEPYYAVTYFQSMYRNRYLGAGVHMRWRIKKGTPIQTRHSIALAMMMRTAVRFESLQASVPFSWTTDSGFSAEDLVSDLLGFYRTVRPMNYFPHLKLVTREEALNRWDHYGPVGSYKNRIFRPLLFPAPSEKVSRPIYGQLPDFMRDIQPFNNFSDDTVRIITNNGTHMNIAERPLKEFR
ncbi:hypothetical protein [Brenneria tiliae]|uniref:DUF4056 domain-containing protein n=1 Tax=Brenneria tiliae TaxID=2914984 RepID=A0ABT0MXK3_9GAMM|nr:hypothetical protein [Brenneria tiliae]MCL2894570.1 hypothetical protein [Brenneria tiliae]